MGINNEVLIRKYVNNQITATYECNIDGNIKKEIALRLIMK